MGEPLLLIEAASRYRGDLEDRRTELLAVALNEHAAFRDELLRRFDVGATYRTAQIATQRTYRVNDGRDRVRIDLEIRLRDETGHQQAVVFIENKFNPDESPRARWFDENQPRNERAALEQEAGIAAERLAAIVSDCDLDNPRRQVPAEYGRPLGWREVAEVAGIAGGQPGWQNLARETAAPASQRVLLEFWAYLKGDTVGALEDEDLFVLGRSARAWERVEGLLTRLSESLGWDEEVLDDWESEAATLISYIGGEPPPGTWLAQRQDGMLYVAITEGIWNDENPVGEPQIYAGWGIAAGREDRYATANSGWPASLEQAGLTALFDREGVYAFGRRNLKDLVTAGSTLSEQTRLVMPWVEETLSSTLKIAEPFKS